MSEKKTTTMELYLADERATVDAGVRLGSALKQGGVIYLEGTLGAGKTTLCRGVLNAFGYSGSVKSPTYTLVEPYDLPDMQLYHFDLYRLADPEELEFMGIRDYFNDESVCLIEWPSKGAGALPQPDLVVKVEPKLPGRAVTFTAGSKKGESILCHIEGMPQ